MVTVVFHFLCREDLHSEIKEKLAEFQMELDTVLRAYNGPTQDNTSVE